MHIDLKMWPPIQQVQLCTILILPGHFESLRKFHYPLVVATVAHDIHVSSLQQIWTEILNLLPSHKILVKGLLWLRKAVKGET